MSETTNDTVSDSRRIIEYCEAAPNWQRRHGRDFAPFR
jgi:hypothetical protein